MGSLSVVNGSIELRASLIIVSCRSRNNSTRMLQIDPKIPRQWTNNKKVLTTPYKLVINIEKGTDGVEIFTTTQEFIIKDSNHRYALLSRDQWQEYNHIPEVYVSIKLMKYEDLVVTDPTDEDEDDFVKITTAGIIIVSLHTQYLYYIHVCTVDITYIYMYVQSTLRVIDNTYVMCMFIYLKI